MTAPLRAAAVAAAFAAALLAAAASGCRSNAPAPAPGPSAEAQELARARTVIDSLQVRVDALNAETEQLKKALEEQLRLQAESGRTIEELQKKLKATEGLSSDLQAQLEQFAKSTPGTQFTADKSVRFEEVLLFESGRAELKPDGKAALAKLAGVLKGRNVFLKIDGHTDADPISGSKHLWHSASNFELGAYRALAVLLHLEKECAVAADHMYLASYGQVRPVAANDTKENKRKNRRVEISFVER
ncbi:MAG: OmpA family protein [Planctomycetes bacterium]|nr:OmpA family protein [Planctomycetota bacterium]